METKQILEYLQMGALIIVVFVASFFLFNHFLVWKYNIQYAANPCDFCVKLNPQVENCFYDKQKVIVDFKDNNKLNPIVIVGNITMPLN